MLQVIKDLLALQERDRKLMRVREELDRIPPERASLAAQAAASQGRLDQARQSAKQNEAERKKLELEVEAQKQQIEKYSLQQFQTRKNEEYRALTHEIDACKQTISQLEDRILDLMEQADKTQREITATSREAQETRSLVDRRSADLDKREAGFKQELQGLEEGRAELAGAVGEAARARYERLLKNKGNTILVGIQRGVCGGCHMTLQRQVVVSCQADHEIVSCPNCGRMLYFTPDMDTSVVE